MARPKKDPKDKVGEAYTVRLTPEVSKKVEVIRKELQEKAPFADVTTSHVLRHLITKASAEIPRFIQAGDVIEMYEDMARAAWDVVRHDIFQDQNEGVPTSVEVLKLQDKLKELENVAD